LIKVCAAFDTLLADEDGLYLPQDFNDRLVLTIKGFMGGFELHQLQQRMQAGRLNRCRRGEWLGQPPPGYVVGPDGKLAFDPDEQARHTVRLVLEQFAALGSINGVLRYLRRNGIDLPSRPLNGPQRGGLQWHTPHRETLRQLLRRPAYAGAYTWGRRATDPRRVRPGRRGSGRIERAPRDCAVFLPDNHQAYISWEQYENNLRRMLRRGPPGLSAPGAVRTDVGLLAGLVVCGQCGHRMQTRYVRSLRYVCQRHALDYAGAPCQSLAGAALDQLVSARVLDVVTPAGLELSQRAAEDCERERATLDRQWRLRLERADQEAARASRQYHAVEPENRLVARTLERTWEEALLARHALEEEYHRFQQAQPVRLSVEERLLITTLARDLPALWGSPRTSAAEKRQVLRLLLERVVVWAPASSQEVKVRLEWTGGVMTEDRVRRPVHSWEQMAEAPELRRRVQAWQADGWTSGRMAEELNRAGYRTPRGHEFSAEGVRQLLSRYGRRQAEARPAQGPRSKPRPADSP
jgi:hypothetical protein